ncbi:MAG: DUF1398 family protein [Chitinophagaceae bacterium]
MNLLEQIAATHKQVKSGADFPAFIQELKKLGVSGYTTFVATDILFISTKTTHLLLPLLNMLHLKLPKVATSKLFKKGYRRTNTAIQTTLLSSLMQQKMVLRNGQSTWRR